MGNIFSKISREAFVVLFLTFSVIIVYFPVGGYPFVLFDDDIYVYENTVVKNGISMAGIKWAFFLNDSTVSYWHPLTWLSLMLDVEIFGVNPAGHHLVNVLIHLANCLLLFFLIKNITGCIWKSAFVAILFALHPVNIESVAWIAERKNVLSTLFWMLTLLCYADYAKHNSWLKYFSAIIIYAFGLLTKPMLITIPFILLLLDFWPLGRFRFNIDNSVDPHNKCHRMGIFFFFNKRLLIEKIPFLLLSLAVFIFSTYAAGHLKLWVSLDTVPLGLRCANALVSYITYIYIIIWPLKLALLYPFPHTIPAWQFINATLLLGVVTFFVLTHAARRPYLAVGWFWYLITLAPVSGVMQAGLWPAMADRWLYVPQIGLFIIFSWGAVEIFGMLRLQRGYIWIVALCTVGLLVKCSLIQIGYWSDSVSLFSNSLAKGGKHKTIYSNLGAALIYRGDLFDAIDNLQEALSIDPQYKTAHIDIGVAYASLDRLNEAIYHFKAAISVDSDNSEAKQNLKKVITMKNSRQEAVNTCLEKLADNPNSPEAHNNVGYAYSKLGDVENAINHYEKSIQLDSNYKKAYNNLGIIHVHYRKTKDAIKLFQAALEIDPKYEVARKNLLNVKKMNKKHL